MREQEQERLAGLDYIAQEQPFRYKIFLIGDKGTKILLAEKAGTWVEALLDTSKLKKLLSLQAQPQTNKEP